MTKDKAMQQALEALSGALLLMLDKPVDEQYRVRYAYLLRVITALREALAQPVQEPVAWMFQHEETGRMNYVSNDGIHNPTMFLEMNSRYALVCPLYTAPPLPVQEQQQVGPVEDMLLRRAVLRSAKIVSDGRFVTKQAALEQPPLLVQPEPLEYWNAVEGWVKIESQGELK